MKRLILWLALLLPIFANAQVNGTIQKTVSTGTIRGNFGSNGIDTLPRVTGVFVDGWILKYHAATNKWYASPDTTYPGLQDSLTKKANKDFSNVASGAIAKSKVDTTSTGLQTVSNFFPKGDTRYLRSSQLGTSAISEGGTTNGLSYSNGNFRLHKVNATNGGVLTTGLDTISGIKRFINTPLFNSTYALGQATFGSTGQGAKINFIEGGGGASNGVLGYGSATSGVLMLTNFGQIEISSTNTSGILGLRATGNSGRLQFRTGATQNAEVFSTGNWLLQQGGTFTDAGYKLDVAGTGRYTGNLTANSFIKSGGTGAQFLMGNGTVQDTTQIQTVSNFFPKGDTRYQTLANLSTDLTASATKYPSVNAVNTGLGLKQNLLNGAGIVEMAGTTPSYLSSTGTGNVVKATSPSLVTPNIGSATGSFLGLGASSPLYSEQLLLSGSTPKIALGSADGYRWTTRIIPSSGEWALRYEEGSLDVLTINRTGNAAFNNFVGVGGVTSPLYSEQFSVSGSTPKIMLGSSDGYRWSSRIIPSSGELAFRYEEGALDAMVIDRLGVVSVPALRIPTGANTGYILTSDSDGDASWQSPTSGMTYKGAWDASTNTPTLADGVGTTGDTYSVSVGGTQFGRSFVAGGQAIYNGTIWQNIGTSSAVTSVNTYTGAVTLTKSDIGLSNVDNTSDLSKPVSTATQTALDLKANIASPTFTGTVTIPNGASLGTPGSMVGTNITGTATGLTAGNSNKWANLNYTGTNAAVTGYVMAYQGGNDFGIADVSYLRTFLGLGSNAYTSTSYAPLASPTFTGTPTLPTGTIAVTQSPGNNSTAVATTAYVDGLLGYNGISSNTYNPTYTSGTNTSGITGSNAHYLRIGNEVKVQGRASLTASSSGASNFTISLPFASALTVGNQLLGNATADTNSTNPVLYAETTTDTAVCEFTAVAGARMTIYYSFTYTIIN